MYTCHTPETLFGRNPFSCHKIFTEINFAVDGSWGPWLPWQPCTASCNGGTQRRERQCNYPPPIYGGRDCEGAGVEEEACNEQPCPGDLNLQTLAIIMS